MLTQVLKITFCILHKLLLGKFHDLVTFDNFLTYKLIIYIYIFMILFYFYRTFVVFGIVVDGGRWYCGERFRYCDKRYRYCGERFMYSGGRFRYLL